MQTLKSLALIIFSVILPGLINAQQIQVTAGSKSLLQSSVKNHKIFGHDDRYYYALEYTGTQYYIKKLDKQLIPVQKAFLKLSKGLTTFQLEYVVDFYDQLYLFVSHSRINNITLYYQKIDRNTLKPDGEMIEITTIRNINGAWADFHFAISRHETKLMIACRTKLIWSGAQFNEYYVFGKDLRLIWKRNDSFSFQGQGPRDNTYMIDETGNISILSLVKKESLLSLIREYRNLYSIYRYTEDGQVFNEYPITLGERYIRGIRIVATDQNELFCAGLFSETYKTGVKGTFMIRIFENGGSGKPVLNNFDEATMAELAGIKEPMIRDEELINYVITDLIFRKNNKVIIIAEQMFHQTYNTFNNLIVTCYNPEGQVDWTRTIPKKQNFPYKVLEPIGVDLVDIRDYIRETGYFNAAIDNSGSYALMAPVDKSGIVVFFNDNIKNITESDGPKAFNQPKKSYIQAVYIDEYGSITKTPLIPWKKKMLFPEPMRYYDTLGDIIIVPAFRNRSVNYYKVQANAIR